MRWQNMFMVSVKLTRKKMLITAVALVLAASAGMFWSRYRGGEVMETTKPEVKSVSEKEQKSEKTGEASKAEKKAKTKIKKVAGKTNDQRIAFIGSFGWEVNPEAAEVMEVIIPKEFDDVYKEYNSIQKMQGCDLSQYAGKRCKRYSYEILNYPGGATDVRVNLLVYNNKIIGGDVCTLQAGGFMHGFAPDSN